MAMINFKLFIVINALHCYIQVHGENLVILRELHVPSMKRSADPLPSYIPLKVSTKDGQFHLVLERNRDIDGNKVKVHVSDGDSEKELHTDDRTLGFYHDAENNAVVYVELVDQDGVVKKKYSGTLVYEQKVYELLPVEKDEKYDQELKDRGEDVTGLHLHVITEVDVSKYIKKKASKDTVLKRSLNGDHPFGKRGKKKNKNNPSKPGVKIDKVEYPKTRHMINFGGKSNQKDERGFMIDKLRGLLKNIEKRNDDDNANDRQKRSSPGKDRNKSRKKRGSSRKNRGKKTKTTEPDVEDYKVDIVFQLDDSVYKYWKEQLSGKSQNQVTSYISTLYKHMFNGMYMAFRRISASETGFKVTPILRRINIMTTASSYMLDSVVRQGTVNGVLNVEGLDEALYQNIRSDSDYYWTKVDHLMVWTRYQLKQAQYPTLGFSPRCSVCEPYYGYSVNRENGLFSFVTATHELSHSLGAAHDGANGCLPYVYIMSPQELVPSTGKVILPYIFSPCSLNEIHGCLNGKHDKVKKTCLSNDPCDGPTESMSEISRPPGESFIPLTSQCHQFVDALFGGIGSRTCNPVEENICSQLKCKDHKGNCFSHSAAFRALPGTPCGKKKWCMWGKCVSKSSSQYTSEYCSSKQTRQTNIALQQPPPGCQDKRNGCEWMAIHDPYSFFLDQDVRKDCQASGYRYGLYFAHANPCKAEYFNTVSCPNSNKAISYSSLCNGRKDCGDGSDEDQSVCNEISAKTPGICDHWYEVPCPKNFQRCMNLDLACNGVNDDVCKYWNFSLNRWVDGGDELTDWCAMLPTKTCMPNESHCNAKNKAHCCR